MKCMHCGSRAGGCKHCNPDHPEYCGPATASAGSLADSPNAKQPRSVPTDTPFVWDLVFADMRERDQMGERKHGTRLQPHNGRDVLKDAYQEALDLVAYLRQAIYERDQA